MENSAAQQQLIQEEESKQPIDMEAQRSEWNFDTCSEEAKKNFIKKFKLMGTRKVNF